MYTNIKTKWINDFWCLFHHIYNNRKLFNLQPERSFTNELHDGVRSSSFTSHFIKTIPEERFGYITPPPAIAFSCHDFCSLCMKATKTSLKPEKARILARTGCIAVIMTTKIALGNSDHITSSTPSLPAHSRTDRTYFFNILWLCGRLSCCRSSPWWSSCGRCSLRWSSCGWTGWWTCALRWTGRANHGRTRRTSW